MTGARALFAGVAAAGLLAGCGGRAPGPADAAPAPVATPSRDTDWHRVATAADRNRLRNWRATWLAAVAEARTADAAAIDREAGLFVPDRALSQALPPPGVYRCRTFKLGAQGPAGRGFTAYSWFDCGVDRDGDVLGFSKTSGSQRPVGLIFADGDTRGVFLGTLVLGDESRPLQYGRDARRDMVGIVERIGERRWRIAFPQPRFESKLDVIEVVPAR